MRRQWNVNLLMLARSGAGIEQSWCSTTYLLDLLFTHKNQPETLIKLYISGNSPYARRARLAVREGGLTEKVEEIAIKSLDQLQEIGVGQKIPVLICDDGTSLCESLIITHYLNDLADGTLMPRDKVAAMKTLELEAVASVLMDSHYVRSSEKYRRDKEHQSADLLAREQSRANSCYDRLNVLVADEGEQITLATIAVISALDYADWRHAEDGWRHGRDALATYYERISQRPAFAETAPKY